MCVRSQACALDHNRKIYSALLVNVSALKIIVEPTKTTDWICSRCAYAPGSGAAFLHHLHDQLRNCLTVIRHARGKSSQVPQASKELKNQKARSPSAQPIRSFGYSPSTDSGRWNGWLGSCCGVLTSLRIAEWPNGDHAHDGLSPTSTSK